MSSSLNLTIPRDAYVRYTEEELTRKHTGTLMNWLKIAYRHNFYYDDKTARFATKEQLISLLDTREHIPNKQERRAARQERAKQKH